MLKAKTVSFLYAPPGGNELSYQPGYDIVTRCSLRNVNNEVTCDHVSTELPAILADEAHRGREILPVGKGHFRSLSESDSPTKRP